MADISSIEAKFSAADQKLAAAEAFLKQFKGFLAAFEQSQDLLQDLTAFYFSDQWIEESDLLHQKSNETFRSAGEDSIWYLLEEHRALNIKMLSLISAFLSKENED